MGEKDEDITVEQGEDSESDNDTSSYDSSFDDDLDVPLSVPSPRPPPRARVVPPLSRLALGGGLGLGGLGSSRRTGDGQDGPSDAVQRERRPAESQQLGPGLRGGPSLSIPTHLVPTPCLSPQAGTPRNIIKPPRLNLTKSSWDVEEPGSRIGANQATESSGCVTVSLLSNGLAIDRAALPPQKYQGQDVLGVVRARMVSSLGVRPEELTLFEVRQLEPGSDVRPECSHVGVAINRSGFSLSALEDILAENKRLYVATEKSTSAVESMHQDLREHKQMLAQEQAKCSEQEAEMRRLQERCRVMEQELAHTRGPEGVGQFQNGDDLSSLFSRLRQQLRRSDGLRLQGQQALDELKREFEALTQDLADSWPPPTYPPQPVPGPLSIRSMGGVSDRLAGVLERLCEEEVLQRLECCLNAKGVSSGSTAECR